MKKLKSVLPKTIGFVPTRNGEDLNEDTLGTLNTLWSEKVEAAGRLSSIDVLRTLAPSCLGSLGDEYPTLLPSISSSSLGDDDIDSSHKDFDVMDRDFYTEWMKSQASELTRVWDEVHYPISFADSMSLATTESIELIGYAFSKFEYNPRADKRIFKLNRLAHIMLAGVGSIEVKPHVEALESIQSLKRLVDSIHVEDGKSNTLFIHHKTAVDRDTSSMISSSRKRHVVQRALYKSLSHNRSTN